MYLCLPSCARLWVFEKRGTKKKKKKNREAWSFPAVCYCLLSAYGVWLHRGLHAFIYQFSVFLAPVVQSVSPSRLRQTIRSRWFVVNPRGKLLSVCFMLLRPLSGVHGTLWFGPLSEHQASVETRVWCGPLAQGFPLELAGLLFSLGRSSPSFSAFLLLLLPPRYRGLLSVVHCEIRSSLDANHLKKGSDWYRAETDGLWSGWDSSYITHATGRMNGCLELMTHLFNTINLWVRVEIGDQYNVDFWAPYRIS